MCPSPEPLSGGAVHQHSNLGNAPAARKQPFGYKAGLNDKNYEDAGKLGAGGMGVVRKVLNRQLNRVEALKTIAKELIRDEAALRLFQSEINANARLRHPGIVVIYGAGDSAEFGPFFTMEYVDGGNLRGWIDERFPTRGYSGEPPPRSSWKVRRDSWEAVRLLKLVAEAVEHMHEREVWHRDLKPTNILLEEDKKAKSVKPKVTDFGLAVLRAELSLTSPAAGTAGYIPPEQARALLASEAGPPEERASASALSKDYFRLGDIYSLGAVLYETLTGRPPYPTPDDDATMKGIRDSRERTSAILKAVIERKQFPPPRKLNPAVPRRLEAICLKCLEYKPQDRYRSAEELAQALEKALRPAPWAWIGFFAVTALLVLALGWSGYQRRVDRQQRITEHVTASREYTKEAKAKQGQESVELLNKARDALARAVKDLPANTPDLEYEMARLTVEIGREYQSLKAYTLAKREFEKLLEQFEERSVNSHDPRWKEVIADAYHWEGVVWQDEKEFEKARERFEKARQLWAKLHDERPRHRAYERYLARAYGYIGDIELESGWKDNAARSYADALRIRTRLAQGTEASAEDKYQLARSQWNTGYFAEWHGDFAGAIKAHEERARTLGQCPPAPDKEFEEEWPSCLTKILELRLLIADQQPLDLENAFAQLEKVEKWPVVGPDLRARILLVRGQCNALAKRRDDARKCLQDATDLIRTRIRGGHTPAEQYYWLAAAHALLSRLAGDSEQAGYHEVAAVIILEGALHRGFRHLCLLQRDPAFHKRLRAREDFTRVLSDLAEKRKQPGTPP